MRAISVLSMALLTLTGCREERQKGMRGLFPPRQSWEQGRSIITFPDSDMTQNDPLSGPLVAELDQQGNILHRLETPKGILAPVWLDYRPQPHWIDGAAWTCGIPAHPGWYVLHRRLETPLRKSQKTPHHPHYHVPRAAGTLYRSRDFGPWEAVARFRTETGFGYARSFVPLRDGSFLGLAHYSFGRGADRSPLARFRINMEGWLEMGELLPLDPSGELPARLTGRKDSKGREELAERPEAHAFWSPERAIATPRGLVVVGPGGCVVLDPATGAPQRVILLPTKEGEWPNLLQAQPTPEGDLVVETGPEGGSDWFPDSRKRITPATRLAEAYFHTRASQRYGTQHRWFRIDTLRGSVTPMLSPPTSSPGQTSMERHLRIRPDGGLTFWDDTLGMD